LQNEPGKKIKTESGVWIPASYKSDRYAKWRERSKLMQQQENETNEADEPGVAKSKKQLLQKSSVDVMITIFCDFCQFSAKKLAFSQKPLL
jgi:hypothetical protein